MKITALAFIVTLTATATASDTGNIRSMKGSSSRSRKETTKKKANKGSSDQLCISIEKPMDATNVCDGAEIDIDNSDCVVEGVVAVLGQAGADVSVGYAGDLDMGDVLPVTDPFYTIGLCPVNVHWHKGAEHRSEGEFDEDGVGPSSGENTDDNHRRSLEGRQGMYCHLYDENDKKFTKDYKWEHCEHMEVGETYEVHWPHSRGGACNTLNQWQSPFYDGVFCHAENLNFEALQGDIGVQAQVFTIVNDEDYYFPNLMQGMIVDAELGMGVKITKYTGSTTGDGVDNDTCSNYTPITWQVDRTCHLISASSFDKMCADMKMQRDDMSEDLYPHGSRELVSNELAANNQVNRRQLKIKASNFVY